MSKRQKRYLVKVKKIITWVLGVTASNRDEAVDVAKRVMDNVLVPYDVLEEVKTDEEYKGHNVVLLATEEDDVRGKVV